jgi:hypothetical protein
LYFLTVFSQSSSITGTARFTKQGKGEEKGAGFEGGSIRYALVDKKGEDMREYRRTGTEMREENRTEDQLRS